MRQHRVGSEGRYYVTHSGGTAPAFTGLPCYARVGTRDIYSVVRILRRTSRSYASDAASVKRLPGGSRFALCYL